MSDAFLSTFNALTVPVQCRAEWLAMLEYCAAYFQHRGIDHPVVLEIGTRLNQQKPFYERLLGARHIGIDITDKEGVPDILGDSRSPETIARVRELAPAVDLLFIDGSHEYADVKHDYETYGPMTRHIIAFHDVNIPFAGWQIKRLWEEIKAKEYLAYSFITLDSWTEPVWHLGRISQIGIGLAVRKEPLST